VSPNQRLQFLVDSNENLVQNQLFAQKQNLIFTKQTVKISATAAAEKVEIFIRNYCDRQMNAC
jgi:hypothetical protein